MPRPATLRQPNREAESIGLGSSVQRSEEIVHQPPEPYTAENFRIRPDLKATGWVPHARSEGGDAAMEPAQPTKHGAKSGEHFWLSPDASLSKSCAIAAWRIQSTQANRAKCPESLVSALQTGSRGHPGPHSQVGEPLPLQ